MPSGSRFLVGGRSDLLTSAFMEFVAFFGVLYRGAAAAKVVGIRDCRSGRSVIFNILQLLRGLVEFWRAGKKVKRQMNRNQGTFHESV